MINHRIKLLITLVLFMVAVAATWTSTQADARALKGASSTLSVARPSVTPTSGDPDIGQGATPPPAPSLKRLLPESGASAKQGSLNEWVRWAGRIWATLYPRLFG